MSDIENLIDGYWQWMRDKTAIKNLKDCVEITTPYLDRHNDYIQIYAQKTEGGFILTDGGETLIDLEQSGCVLDSPRRQAILNTILHGFGIQKISDELRVSATTDDFPLRKHSLIQAILSVNDMFCLASSTVESLFSEDVAHWLDAMDVRFVSNVKFSGKTGFDHMFDCVIPKSHDAPERIVKAINNPNKNLVQNMILAWVDTKENRSETSKAYAVLNDNEKMVGSTINEALYQYHITPIAWSQRDQFRNVLTA